MIVGGPHMASRRGMATWESRGRGDAQQLSFARFWDLNSMPMQSFFKILVQIPVHLCCTLVFSQQSMCGHVVAVGFLCHIISMAASNKTLSGAADAPTSSRFDEF